jgi:hypothetical protein
MAQPAANTTDRLPWLTEASRPAHPPPKQAKRRPWGWIAGGAAVLAVAAGSYWFIAREPQQNDRSATASNESAPAEQVPSDDSLNIPSVSDMTAADELTAEPLAEPVPPQEKSEDQQQRSADISSTEEVSSDPTATGITASPGAETSAPAPVQPLIRGRIIQLGAYPTRVQADFAWRAAVKRWPYLASKPRLISPLEVRSSDGKGTRMYRLQLATSSQAQSVVICQQLAGDGQSCVVVY